MYSGPTSSSASNLDLKAPKPDGIEISILLLPVSQLEPEKLFPVAENVCGRTPVRAKEMCKYHFKTVILTF